MPLFTWAERRHAHARAAHAISLIPAARCGVLQDLSFLLPISLHSRYSIKSSRDVLENWPLFSQCLGGEEGREGRTVQEHGETKLETDAQSSSAQEDKLKGQSSYMLSPAVFQMKGPLAYFTAMLKEPEHTKNCLWALGCGTRYSLKIISDRTTPWRYIWRQEWYKM